MTRTVTDAALLLQVIAGYDAQDPAASTCPFRTTWPGLSLDVLAASWDPHRLLL